MITRKRLSVLLVILIIAVGAGLRYYAANRLTIDADERTYLRAAWQYNNLMRQGQWNWLVWNDYNSQHPPFYKAVYGFALLTQPPLRYFNTVDFVIGKPIADVKDRDWGLTARYVSVISGTLTTFVLALVNPLAGLFFATDTTAVKYNSTIFLEALPVLASLLAAVCYLFWYNGLRRSPAAENLLWLGASAGFLGLSIACKYNYGVVGIAVAIHFMIGIIAKKISVKDLWKLAAFTALVLVAFFICDPYLWRHTFSRLYTSLSFHIEHTQSTQVKSAGYRVWQTIVWFTAPFPKFFPISRNSFLIRPDIYIGLLAIIGIPRLVRRESFYFLWLVVGLSTLLIWPTKWPQYTMIVMAPFCLSAALGAGWLFDLLKDRLFQPRNRVQKDTAPDF